jgi:hypothetical protein
MNLRIRLVLNWAKKVWENADCAMKKKKKILLEVNFFLKQKAFKFLGYTNCKKQLNERTVQKSKN